MESRVIRISGAAYAALLRGAAEEQAKTGVRVAISAYAERLFVAGAAALARR